MDRRAFLGLLGVAPAALVAERDDAPKLQALFDKHPRLWFMGEPGQTYELRSNLRLPPGAALVDTQFALYGASIELGGGCHMHGCRITYQA